MRLIILALFIIVLIRGPSLADTEYHYRRYRDDQKLRSLEELIYMFEHLVPVYYYRHIPDINDCVQKIIKGGLQKCFDENTRYFTKQEIEEADRERRSEDYGGIGVTFHQSKDQIKVIDVQEDTPAAKAGLRIGDVILEASGASGAMQTLAGKTKDEIIGIIKGKKGTLVRVLLQRGDLRLTFQIMRERIPLLLVKSKIISPKIAYIKIDSFSNVFISQRVKYALDEIAYKDTDFIFDVRNNPGGYFRETMEILTFFDGDPSNVIATERRHRPLKNYDTSSTIEDMIYNNPGLFWTRGEYSKRKIVVLVNGESASSAEIFSGYLQQLGAVVVGGADLRERNGADRFSQ